MKPTERAALDRQMLKLPSIEEHYARLQMRFPMLADAGCDHWAFVLISEGCEALGHDLVLLLSLLHPADAAKLVSQRGEFKVDKALDWIRQIIMRHYGGDAAFLFDDIQDGERWDDEQNRR